MKFGLMIACLFYAGVLCGMKQEDAQILTQAAYLGDLTKVKELVEQKGMDINSPNRDGLTALHYAAMAGHGTVVSYLLCQGALIAVSTAEGLRPVHLAAKKGYVPVLRSLIQFRDKKDSKSDPNVKDARGYTPLHYAAANGHLEAVQYLHAWGAQIDSVADDDITPLRLAKEGRHDHVAQYLTLSSHTENKPLRAKY